MKLGSYLRYIANWALSILSYKKLVIYIGDMSIYIAYFINGKVTKDIFLPLDDTAHLKRVIEQLPKFYELIVVCDNKLVEVHHNSFSNLHFNEKNVLKIIRNNLPKDALIWSKSEFMLDATHNREFAHVNTAIVGFENFDSIASSLDSMNILDGIYFTGFIILSLLQKSKVQFRGKLLIVITITSTTGISALAIENGIIMLRKIVPAEYERSDEYVYGQCKHIIESILLTFKANIEQFGLESQCIWILPQKYNEVFNHAENNRIDNIESKLVPDVAKFGYVEKYLCTFLVNNQNRVQIGKNSIIDALVLAKRLKFGVRILLGAIAIPLTIICFWLSMKLLMTRVEISTLVTQNTQFAQEYQNVISDLGLSAQKVDLIIGIYSIVRNINATDKIDFEPIDTVNSLASKIYQISWIAHGGHTNDTTKFTQSSYSFNCGFSQKLLYDCKSHGSDRYKELLESYLPDYTVNVNTKQVQVNNEMCRLSFKCQKK